MEPVVSVPMRKESGFLQMVFAVVLAPFLFIALFVGQMIDDATTPSKLDIIDSNIASAKAFRPDSCVTMVSDDGKLSVVDQDYWELRFDRPSPKRPAELTAHKVRAATAVESNLCGVLRSNPISPREITQSLTRTRGESFSLDRVEAKEESGHLRLFVTGGFVDDPIIMGQSEVFVLDPYSLVLLRRFTDRR